MFEALQEESGLELAELLVSEHLPATSSTSGEWRTRLSVWKRLVDLRRYRTTTGPDAQLHYITVATKQGVQATIWAPLVKTGQINWGNYDSPRFESSPQQGYQVKRGRLPFTAFKRLLGPLESESECTTRRGVVNRASPGNKSRTPISGKHHGRGCSGGRIRAAELTCTQGMIWGTTTSCYASSSWNSIRESCDNHIKGSTSATTYGGGRCPKPPQTSASFTLSPEEIADLRAEAQKHIFSDERRKKKQRLAEILSQVTALTTEAQALCRALEEEGASD
eukprot:4874088-Amphidinium_carterae.5